MLVKTCVYPKGNFGDEAVNSYLVEKITGKKPIMMSISKNKLENNYLISGSVLASADERSTIWGAGFLSREDKIKVKPQRICAVRGKLSRKKLLDQGVNCPEVYGDPSLLLPLFYKPKKERGSKIGIIPHYKDKDKVDRFRDSDYFNVIDICSGVENVIDEICSCSRVVSSSLHGLVVAQAYGVPHFWVKFSDGIKGGNFKFLDFYSTISDVDLDKLYKSCPFKNGDV